MVNKNQKVGFFRDGELKKDILAGSRHQLLVAGSTTPELPGGQGHLGAGGQDSNPVAATAGAASATPPISPGKCVPVTPPTAPRPMHPAGSCCDDKIAAACGDDLLAFAWPATAVWPRAVQPRCTEAPKKCKKVNEKQPEIDEEEEPAEDLEINLDVGDVIECEDMGNFYAAKVFALLCWQVRMRVVMGTSVDAGSWGGGGLLEGDMRGWERATGTLLRVEVPV